MKQFILIMFLLLSFTIYSQVIPYPEVPDWESAPEGRISTGLGIADINGDGWKDIIVADGNDIQRQHLVVYYNQGDGTFPLSPDWESSDIDYHGHLVAADFNNDQWIDVAVSVYIGEAGFSSPGRLKVYYNQEGELQSNPGFESENFYTFSCAAGDADGDGDIDIAVACGEPYGSLLDYGRIYYNNNGSFNENNIWESDILMGSLDVEFGDIDLNGFLDVIFTCEGTPNYIYMADESGTIPNTPSWQSSDEDNYINSVDVGYYFMETQSYSFIVMTGNDQLGGEGRVKMYSFEEFPAPSVPSWESSPFGYGSGITLYRSTQSDYLDLFYGGWWLPLNIATGENNGFETIPSYTSMTNSVIEAILTADLGKEAIFQKEVEFEIDNEKSVVLLPDQVIESVNDIAKNDIPLEVTDYKFIPGKNRITFTDNLVSGDILTVKYNYSAHNDIIITNWDSGKGNYIFYNTTQVGNDEINQNKDVIMYPNPAADHVYLNFVSNVSRCNILIYDLSGKLISQYDQLQGTNNNFLININNIESGWYMLTYISKEATGHIPLIINK